MAILLATALGASVHGARAATTLTLNVTTTLDGSDPTPGDSRCDTAATDPAHGLCSLRAAVQTASSQAASVDSVVNVPASSRHYYLTISPGPITVQKATTGTITINGAQRPGVVIDGSQFRGGTDDIHVYSDAEIQNVTITGGYGFGAGGVSLISGNLSLYNVHITRNSGSSGGGVYQSGSGNLAIDDTVIDHNTALRSGCTISCDRSSPAIGGGMNLSGGGNTTLTYTVISNNTADYGGGMYVNNELGTTIRGSNLVIDNNAVSANGGGIDAESYYNTSPAMTLSDSVVENNVAQTASTEINASGAGIYSSSYLQLSNVRVDTNRVGTFASKLGLGGGIDNDFDGTLLMTGGSIDHNISGNYGGGLLNFSIATLRNVTVTANHAADQVHSGVGGKGQGGGIYSATYTTLDLEGGSVTSNGAGLFGGGIASFTHDMTANGANITGNLAGGPSGCPGFGGGMYVNTFQDVAATITLPNPGIHHGTVGNNSAQDPTVSATCSSYPVSTCSSQGGGIFVNWENLPVDANTYLTNNRACSGGGIYVGSSGSVSFNGVLSGNSASGNGGAMFVSAESNGATIAGSRILGNHALGQSGGIYNLAPVTLTNTIFSGNTAPTVASCINLLSPCQ